MNEVKDICDRMLDMPAPPLRDSGEVLDIARRSARRRARVTAAGSGLAVAATAAAVVTLSVTGRPAPPPAQGPPAGQATTSSAAQHQDVPPARGAAVHDRKMAQVLQGAVPAGYTATPEFPFSTDTTVYPPMEHPGDRAQLLAVTSLLVSAGGGTGVLSAYLVTDGVPAPTGDLCSAGIAARFRDAGDRCETVVVNGVPVRVTTGHSQDRGEVRVATRFLRGGHLTVSAAQGVTTPGPDTHLPPEYTVVGTVDEAGLAVLDKVAAGGNNSANGEGDGAPNIPVTISKLSVVA